MLRKKSQIFALVISLLAFSVPGHSSDENGRYAGQTISCGKWVSVREHPELDVSTLESFYNLGWIRGYITAYNSQTPDTYDIQGNTDLESIELWLDNFCKENPLKELGEAMQFLTDELYLTRIIKTPE